MIKDVDAYPVFALVNKVTGDAIRGSEGFRRGTVELAPYNPFYKDMSMNLDAFRGDGTNIVLSLCCQPDNYLQWKIVPCCNRVTFINKF
ncbi:hypothetical protein HU200_063866 [Digitaria exilis]|uniref:Uncharacterized protein n=1 Tax=Digitaria exilis TaxID=1010633 RepID=A0A835A4E0_9POAL|nr:hypothetical protein HU200_063866 [Digitaria exilis]